MRKINRENAHVCNQTPNNKGRKWKTKTNRSVASRRSSKSEADCRTVNATSSVNRQGFQYMHVHGVNWARTGVKRLGLKKNKNCDKTRRRLSVRLSACLSVCLSVCLYVCPSFFLSRRLPVYLSVCLSVCIPELQEHRQSFYHSSNCVFLYSHLPGV